MKEVRETVYRMFVENAGFKLVALVSALILWWIVRGQTTRDVEAELPVVITARPTGQILATQTPATIRIRIRGNLQKLTEALVRRPPYELDLSTFESGETVVFSEDQIERAMGRSVRVLSVSPSSFVVQFDRMVKKKVPVAVAVLKGPGPYWRAALDRAEVSPPMVEVTGPSSVIEGVKQIHTDPVDLSTYTQDFTGKVSLEAREGMKVRPDSVRVVIPVWERDGEKIISGVKVTVRNCPDGFICEASPPFFQVLIKGKERLVAMVTEDNIHRYVYVDAAQLPIPKELLQRQFSAVRPTVDALKGAEITLTMAKYFNVTVTRQ